MSARILQGPAKWFNRTMQDRKADVEEADSSIIDPRKLEHANRLVDRIIEVTLPIVQSIADHDGEDVFASKIEFSAYLVDRLSDTKLVDTILSSDNGDSDANWLGKPMRFYVMAKTFRKRF